MAPRRRLLANYAVSHVPMMGGVAPQGYYMMPPSMGYPWPGAPQQPYDAPYVAAQAAAESMCWSIIPVFAKMPWFEYDR